MRYFCAVLDDYHDVSRRLANWSGCGPDVEITVFNNRLDGDEAVSRALADFHIVCLMRERTPFPRTVIEALPNLRLIVTTGMRNAAIDLAAARDRGVMVCGTQTSGQATAELVFAHMLEFARKVGFENAQLKKGQPWQTTVGIDLAGKTLGVVGLGRLGRRVAQIGAAFGMNVIAWSENLTRAKCEGTAAKCVSKEELLSTADFVSIHLQLSDRTRGLFQAADLALLKPAAFLINTSRGPIIDEAALIEILRDGRIAGAGIDVFDAEPLARDHPFRSIARAQITPHLGYVTTDGYRLGYGQTVEDIAAFIAGKPVRIIEA